MFERSRVCNEFTGSSKSMLNLNVSTCWLSEYIFSLQEGQLTAKIVNFDTDWIAMQYHILL